jgi:hypothetical protein
MSVLSITHLVIFNDYLSPKIPILAHLISKVKVKQIIIQIVILGELTLPTLLFILGTQT